MSTLSLLANHLWQSTVFAAVAAFVALFLRQNRAAARHWLWLAVSMKFLIPLSPLIELGRRIQWHSAPALATPASVAIGQLGEPFVAAARITASGVRPVEMSWFPFVLCAIWLCGFAVIVVRWWSRWRWVRGAVHAASELPIEGPVRVMSSPVRLEPGIFGVLNPVLLLPEGIADRLTTKQLRAILAHEFCHVRRRDNVWAAAHMVVEAVFWFHPLVWWIGAKLLQERELACDEEVVRLERDPANYAAGILQVCRFYLESPLPCASGVTGADLDRRIENIMSGRVLRQLTGARKVLLAGLAIAAIAGPVAVGFLNAQAREALRFEVASIKHAPEGFGRGSMDILPGGGLRMGGVTLHGLISLAYGVRPELVSGGPNWAGTESYSILAKPEQTKATSNPPSGTTTVGEFDQMRERLRNLLADRFHLVVRTVGKESSGYFLVLAKDGTKLTPTTKPLPPGTVRSNGVINGRSGTMAMLAAVLTGYLGTPIADQTGLTGNYDYKLEFAEDLSPGAAGSDTPAASIFTALQEQLGLKLEKGRVTVDSIIVEQADRPAGQ